MKKIGTAILPSLLHRLNIFSTENKYVSFSNVFVKIIFLIINQKVYLCI